jgi:hypothetical protein
MGDSPPPLDPPRPAQDHVEVQTSPGAVEEVERKEDDQLTLSQISPSKTDSGPCESSDCSAPKPRVPIAISPMRPSKKRASSAEQESDTEPGGALPDEWEKRHLITQSNREGGEVRGCGDEGKEVQETRRPAGGENPRALLQASRRKNGEASSSLTLTRRLKSKAIRESPRVRKLRDKWTGRVIGGKVTGRRPAIGGAPKNSRVGHATTDTCSFPGNEGASTSASVATHERKGTDETTGPTMPYDGDNVSFVFSWFGSI